ncbi:hypothetical protein [Nonomuraea typhae]|uniref:Uncharacterized protein n=1 Tax=Nonomuraea typhae TaxID=2603600 RepID=A0ABW7ZEV5_9ACTN
MAGFGRPPPAGSAASGGIAAGVGIKVSHRPRQAVRVTRGIAANHGDRLDGSSPRPGPSPPPARLDHPDRFDTMAQAADASPTKIAGIDKLGPQVVRRENTSLLTKLIADLQARLSEPGLQVRRLRRGDSVACAGPQQVRLRRAT